MSTRTNGTPLWKVRPIIEGVIRNDREQLFAGTEAEVIAHIAVLDLTTGVQYAAKEVEDD